MPSLSPVTGACGVALALLSLVLAAVTATSPPVVFNAPFPPIAAWLEASDRFRASAPARPTALAPAPEVACASAVWVRAASSATLLALMVTFWPNKACAAERTRFTATAAPMPTLVVLPATVPSPWATGSALPSAVSRPSTLFLASSVRAPTVVTETPSARLALVREFCRFRPAAAATDTLPSLVLAEALPSF